ncbi:hypothetical protein V1511DRAFT_458811 [Dipodascopsis uninucleata]
MDPSRANSPIHSSSDLDDHRNQPDSLPIRVSFSTDVPAGSLGQRLSSDSDAPHIRHAVSTECAVYDCSEDEDVREVVRKHSSKNLSSHPRSRGSNVVIDIDGETLGKDDISHLDSHNGPGYYFNRRLSQSSPIQSTMNRARSYKESSHQLSKSSRRPTIESISDQVGSLLGTEKSRDLNVAAVQASPSTPNIKDEANRRKSIDSSDSEAHSHANSEDETEEDVCFPMNLEHKRINGIDFDEIEEFAAAQRLELRMGPMMTRRHDNDLGTQGHYGRRMTFTTKAPSGTTSSTEQTLAVKNDGVLPGIVSVSSPSDSSGTPPSIECDEKQRITDTKTEEVLKSSPISPEIQARLADSQDRFSLFCSESEETIHAPEICLLTGEKQTFANLFDTSNGTWWLDCLNPTDTEMKMLAKTFGIHPLTTEDIRVQETREKVELFRSYYFVCFRTFEHDKVSEDFLEPLNMYIIVFRDGLLSFHFSPFQHTANVRRRVRQLRDYVAVSADWICYALIDDITDGFAPVIREIEQEADGIEDSVFVARDSDFGNMLKRIGDARKTIMTLMRLLSGKADVIKMFAKRCNEHWDVAPKGEIGLYLGDIQDHIVTMYQNLSAYEKILSRSHANYLAQLQVESFHANNRINDMLSKVTLVGTILVPLNVITGLFGMNVTVPGDGQGTLAWFFGIVGVLFLIVILAFFIARRWLSTVDHPKNDEHVD